MKTIYKNIRFIFLFIGTSLFLLPAVAQTTNMGYFMKSQYNKASLNPALRPEQGYVGIPVFSDIYVDYKTNTFNLDHFLFPGKGENGKTATFLNENVTAEDFLKNISNNNYANLDASVTIASVGFYKGDGFWFIDLSAKANVDFNLPYDVFKFAKQGLAVLNENGESVPVSGYDLKDIRGRATAYAELGVGHSRPFLNNKLVVGLKAKLLFGLANADLHVKQLKINTGKDLWTMQSEATLEGSILGYKPQYDENGKFNWTMDKDGSMGISGFGLGFDLGATYKLSGLADAFDNVIDEAVLDRFTISAALTDIGFISWSSNSSRYLASTSNNIVTGNYDIFFKDNDRTLEKQFKDIGDTIKNTINLANTEKSGGRTTALKMRMNWGLEYEIIKNKLSAGILSTTQFTPAHNITEFTLAGTYKPVSWFEAGLSYSFVHSKFNTFGLALNLVPAKGINLFLASDYIIPHVNSDWYPTTTKALNFQFGLTIPLGGHKRIN